VWSPAGASVLGTGAEVRKMLLRGDANHRFFQVQALPGTVTNWLAGLSELDLRPARITALDGGILAEGMRATAVGIDSNDFVTGRFQFDYETQCLRLVNYEVVPQVGVFYDRFFTRDVPTHPTGQVFGVDFNDYQWVTLTSSNILINLDLEVGQVLNLGLKDQTVEYTLELLDPAGQGLAYSIQAAQTPVYIDGYPILRSGTYQVRIRPRSANPNDIMSCNFFFANNNMTPLASIANGTNLQVSLRANTHDYAKYSMNLTQGQIVRLPQPSPGIGLLILNARSQKLTNQKGLPLIFAAPADGTYYLFVYKIVAGDVAQNYNGTMTIGN